MRLTKAERHLFSKMGKRGGPARANKLTPERRSEIAKHAAAVRWAKEKAETLAAARALALEQS